LPPALAPAHNGRVLIPTFREVQDDITAMLRQQGYLAAILVDLSPLAHIEKSFGGAAFRSLREQVDPLLQSMRERFRQDDFVTRDEREGDRFLLFLSGPRRWLGCGLRAGLSTSNLLRGSSAPKDIYQRKIIRLQPRRTLAVGL